VVFGVPGGVAKPRMPSFSALEVRSFPVKYWMELAICGFAGGRSLARSGYLLVVHIGGEV